MIHLAEAFRVGLNPLAWKIIPNLDIGPLEVSPHGIGIALGYLAGAQLMVRRAKRFGGPDENDIWNALFWALIGAMIGARVGYVLGHVSEVTDGGDDILGIFRVWEGGISLLGGITGGLLIALPYVIRKKMGFWRMVDLAAPGLALGIVIGRIGDLMIGDHLGEPTNFFLGWRCLGSEGEPPLPADTYLTLLDSGQPPSLGCYNLTLHQTAIYDFFSTLLLLGVLLWVGRRVRKPGLMAILFVLWYGTVRMITDFLRVDQRYFGLTGSQLLSLGVGLTCLYLLVRYGGAPPRWQRSPEPEPEGGEAPETRVSEAPTVPEGQDSATESDEEADSAP